jgi:hypothetical protein
VLVFTWPYLSLVHEIWFPQFVVDEIDELPQLGVQQEELPTLARFVTSLIPATFLCAFA